MEMYFINGSKKGKTWEELLDWCYDEIVKEKGDCNWRDPFISYKYDVTPHTFVNKANEFFSNFGHCDNDGQWSGGYATGVYDWVFDPETCRSRQQMVGTKWIPLEFTPKKFRVTDSYGRVVPSGIIKTEFFLKKEFRPKAPLKRRTHFGSWRSRLYDHERDFRKGPVPGIHHWRNGSWLKYKGDHCGITPWKRSWYAARIERKECYDEYGVTFRRQKKIPHSYGEWPGKTWKRTRKEKQWM